MEQKDLFSYLFSPAGVVALIIALGEELKLLGVESKLLPLFDLFFGIIFGLLIYKHEFGYSLSKSIILGIALGLSSCGLFSGFKNLIFK